MAWGRRNHAWLGLWAAVQAGGIHWVFRQLDFSERTWQNAEEGGWRPRANVYSVCRVAWHCKTNAASMGGRRTNLLFLLLVGCNSMKKLPFVLWLEVCHCSMWKVVLCERLPIPGSHLLPCSSQISPLAGAVTESRCPVLFQWTLWGAWIFCVFSWFAVNVPCFLIVFSACRITHQL